MINAKWKLRIGAVAVLFLVALLPVLVVGQENAGPDDAKIVYQFNPAKLTAFSQKMTGANATAKNGDWPSGWSGNLWQTDAKGEFALADVPVGGKGIVLRNLEGTPSTQFYNWQAIELPGGRKYAITFSYYAPAGAGGNFDYHGQNITKVVETLGDTGGQWKTVTKTFEAADNAKLELLFQNLGGGADKAIFLGDVIVKDVGAAPRTVSATQPTAPPVASNATSQLPDLKPQAVSNAYYRSIVAQVQNLHPKVLLLGTDPDVALEKFQRNSVQGRAEFSLVPVVGQPFKKALRIDSDRKPQEWMTHIQSLTKENIRRGDVLYVTAWVRAVRITNGKVAGEGRLYASHERGGNQKDSSGLGIGDFAIPPEWTRVHIPLSAERDFGPDDEMKLMFTFGHTNQIVEIGGIAALNFGPTVAKESLPHAELKLDYPGREPNAAWRKAAAERIEKHRKGNLSIVVTDAAGKPVRDAAVKVEMKRHAFLFGSSTPVGMLPGQNVKPWNADFARTAGASDEDKRKLQENFLKLFNATTASVTWTLWYGGDQRISRDDILAGLKWFKANNIPVLNSQVVYPSPEFTPGDVVKNLMNKEHAAEFGKAVNDYIIEQVTTLGPYLASVQIANEIEGRPQYTDILGRDAVVEWFKTAQRANPTMGREINGPYSLGAGVVTTKNRGNEWPTSESLQYYYDLISYLLKKGAPIQYIGFQNHGGLGMPGPEAVLKSLDQFSTFNLPLEVTEFEVTLQNGKDPEQRKYQADYLRDYFTAVFSHPSVRTIILQDFWQPGAWQYEGASAFFNADWSMNPHGQQYMDLVLNKWWTRINGTTGQRGDYATRGFLGNYEITVTKGGKTKTVQTMLPKAGQAVKVVLD